MFKIINDTQILEWLNSENTINDKIDVNFSNKQLQIHIDFGCTCKITQDNKGNWFFPCKKHFNTAFDYRKKGFIH
jgi:hypothetical protein